MVKSTRQKAEGGCVESMRKLASWYSRGEHGLTKDLDMAFHWAKKGADLKDATSMAKTGWHCLHGNGTEKQPAHGIAMITAAAMKGSASQRTRRRPGTGMPHGCNEQSK